MSATEARKAIAELMADGKPRTRQELNRELGLSPVDVNSAVGRMEGAEELRPCGTCPERGRIRYVLAGTLTIDHYLHGNIGNKPRRTSR